MPRKAALVVTLALAFPLLAIANNFSFRSSGGQITNTSNTLSLAGSRLMGLSGFNGGGFIVGNLGSLTFTTGALTSGNLAAGATFAAGGSFVATARGTHGLTQGVLFQGTFTSPVSWVAVWNPKGDGNRGNWTYELSGVVTGVLSSGQKLSARFVAYTFDVPNGAQFSSSVRFNDGVASLTAPEPGTMALLGSGLVGIAAVGLRKRTKRSRRGA